MKRVHRSIKHDIWQVNDKYIITDSNKRPSKIYPELEHDSLEDCIHLCDVVFANKESLTDSLLMDFE